MTLVEDAVREDMSISLGPPGSDEGPAFVDMLDAEGGRQYIDGNAATQDTGVVERLKGLGFTWMKQE